MYCSQIVDLNVLWERMKQYIQVKDELERHGEATCPNCFNTMFAFNCPICGNNLEELGKELQDD